MAAFTRAAALGRSPALAHYHRAIAHPLAGDFADGWRDYAARLAVPALRPRAFDRPRADGTPLRGRRPLVICERGYGDVFQFIRLLSAPRGQRGAVVFECPQELRALLAPLVAGIDVLPLTAGARRFAVVSADADFPAGDTRARYSKP